LNLFILVKEVARYLKYNVLTIDRYCKSKKLFNGFYWEYLNSNKL